MTSLTIDHFTSSSPNSRSRHAPVDWLRYISCAGIVWFHAEAPGGAFALAGLPILVALSVAYAARSSHCSDAVSRRARRLLIPWLAWSGIYAALKIADAIVSHHSIASEFSPWMLLTGTEIFLWFLPFTFFVTVGVAKFRPAMSAIECCFFAVVFTLLAALAAQHGIGKAPAPFPQIVSVLPAVFIGMVLVRCGTGSSAVYAGAVLAFATAVIALTLHWPGGKSASTAPLVVGIVWSLARYPIAPAWSRTAGEISFGVYLVHPVFLDAFSRLCHFTPTVAAIGAILLATAFSHGIRHTPVQWIA